MTCILTWFIILIRYIVYVTMNLHWECWSLESDTSLSIPCLFTSHHLQWLHDAVLLHECWLLEAARQDCKAQSAVNVDQRIDKRRCDWTEPVHDPEYFNKSFTWCNLATPGVEFKHIRQPYLCYHHLVGMPGPTIRSDPFRK